MAEKYCEKCGKPHEGAGALCVVCAETVYQQATQLQNRAASFGDWETAAKLFLSLAEYRDAAEKAAACQAAAENTNREAIYQQAIKRQGTTAEALEGKAALLRSIAGYRDAEERAAQFQAQADALLAAAEQTRRQKEEEQQAEAHTAHQKQQKKRLILFLCVGAAAIILLIVLATSVWILPAMQYKQALALYEAGNYVKAADTFLAVAPYKDSEHYLQKTHYQLGLQAVQQQDDNAAANHFANAGNVEDAPLQLALTQERLYETGLTALRDGNYATAQEAFNNADDYLEAKALKHFCRALRVWNGDSSVKADKLDLTKAETPLWNYLDGLWYNEQHEVWISKTTKESPLPDLMIRDNTLYRTLDGVAYQVELLSLTKLRLTGNGMYAGTYEKA